MKKIKVCILGGTDYSRFFSNGLYQNAWSLAKMLDVSGDFDVSIASKDKSVPNSLVGVKVRRFSKALLKKQDIIIQIVFSLNDLETSILHKSGGKSILIKYGNNLCSDLVTFVQYSVGLKPVHDQAEWFRVNYKEPPDLVLYSPHFEFQKEYFSLTASVNSDDTKQCPYIWNPYFIKNGMKLNWAKLGGAKKGNPAYERGDKRNRSIALVEPSIAFLKTNLIPIIMTNKVFEDSSDLIEKATVFNCNTILKESNSKPLVNRLSTLAITRSGVLKLSPRQAMTDIFTHKARMLVSHQMMNSLNYTYFEFALNGYPFVHNSELLSDYGYYYNGSEVLSGVKKIKEALHHDELSDLEMKKYRESCDEMIWKHSPDNEKNISTYIDLIKSVL
tara:strand:- start:12797 stop:13960 length:1164 start_codon:yes stop_codon:yes gene_type:complete